MGRGFYARCKTRPRSMLADPQSLYADYYFPRGVILKLFKPVVEAGRLHRNFKSVLISHRKAERDLLESWVDGFVDRDGKLVKEFQTSFNSTFWEIYLFAAFKEYGFDIDFSKPSPDFLLSNGKQSVVVEAVTANAAQGKPNEWDRIFGPEEMEKIKRFKELNKEAIIRLSNSILSKWSIYESKYKKLDHVKGKPFVIAVAPFEQPLFNHQYDRPITALLYDYYVDEDAFLDNPEYYPMGPPGVNLGFVEKDNGAEIELGLFNDDYLSEISAVVFSCVATWGKLSSMSNNPAAEATVYSLWATPPDGVPEQRVCSSRDCDEGILDGLQVFHNPYAKKPIDPDFFRGHRVVQAYFDENKGRWVYEGKNNCLQYRMTTMIPQDG